MNDQKKIMLPIEHETTIYFRNRYKTLDVMCHTDLLLWDETILPGSSFEIAVIGNYGERGLLGPEQQPLQGFYCISMSYYYFYWGPSNKSCEAPIVIAWPIIIIFSHFECIFEGLDMLEKLGNLAHTSQVRYIAILYGSWLRVWQGGSRAPPKNKRQPFSLTYLAELWSAPVQTNKKVSCRHALNPRGSILNLTVIFGNLQAQYF